jgi:MoaA/NifB/PqqE/SkfB family radical SAM enzyme
MALILQHKKISLQNTLLRASEDNTHLTLPASEFSWLDRFPVLKAAVQIMSDGLRLDNAILQGGKVQLPGAIPDVNDIFLELPYYTCNSLYKDHIVLPLDGYTKKKLPDWIDKNIPLHFYSALVVLNDSNLVNFNRCFDGYENFTQYIEQALDSRSDIHSMRWGIKVLASKLPHPIAASREICFHLGHEDISLPLQIGISPTNACNLRCTICGSQAHLDKSAITREFMKREVFEKLAETMFPFCKTVELNSLGEPTLHKDFGYFVDTVNKYDCILVLQTNGTNLTDKILQALGKAQGRLSLSIDATGILFEEQRVNASWAKVEANVRKLMAVRDKAKLMVTLTPTLTRKSMVDAVNLCVWANELGIDSVDFHYYDPIIDGIEQSPTSEEKAALEKSLRDYIHRHEPNVFITLQYSRLSPQSLRNYMKRFLGNAKNSLFNILRNVTQKRQAPSNICPAPSNPQKFSSGRYYDPNLPKLSPQQSYAHPCYVCAAPLTNAVINLTGDISVCCKTQTTVFGSGMTDEEFFASWFGEQMQMVRRSFLRESPTLDCIPECKGCIAKYGHIN